MSFIRSSMQQSTIVLFLLCFAAHCSTPATAYIYVQNNTYASLPALFGRFLLDGKTYSARLQFFHDNPYLCELDERTRSKFVLPTGPQISDARGNNLTLQEPVILMVGRGQCPFQKKAANAESLHDSIRFLLVYNFNVDSDSAFHDSTNSQEDVLVPMYSQFGNTRLVLLSISHRTGTALKKFLSQQPAEITNAGGPLIEFDSDPPLGILTAADLQSMMLTALGLFFMLISFTGCLVILAGTYSQIAAQQESQGGPVRRRLLTVAEVNQLTAATSNCIATAPSSPATDLEASNDSSSSNNNDSLDQSEQHDPEEHQCAVCLDEFESDTEITALPCNHLFHTDCILPWLTERQSKCPLCKFDVLQHLRQQSDFDECAGGARASLWDRVWRYRWTSVQLNEIDVHQDGILSAVVAENDLRLEEDGPGVELTEQRRVTSLEETITT